jgi:hypothetical protein
MKQTNLFALLFTLLSYSVFAQDSGKFGVEYFGKKPIPKFREQNIFGLKNNNPIPAFIEFYQGAEPDEEGFLVWSRKSFWMEKRCKLYRHR